MLLGEENKINYSFIKGILSWILDNIVTIIFVLFVLVGFMVSQGVPMNYFLKELSDRIFRNSFLVLSLIIPVLAGLGLNFGIVIGAMSGQAAIALARYHGMGGASGLLFCFVVSFFIAALCGYFTGRLYNKTRGQEMIASLIVGYFANGVYQFIFLFAVGVIITVSPDNPIIKPDGVGVNMTVDLVPVDRGGLKYALENIYKIPFIQALLIISLVILAILLIVYYLNKKRGEGYKNHPASLEFNVLMCLAAAGIAAHAIYTGSGLTKVGTVPVVTGILIIGLCIFTELIMKTKLGQDFRSVGQNRHIAEVSGINVDRTRIIATMISTVLAAWGQLIYIQNMGTLNTYGAHMQIGMFSVAALLVGGASTSRASIKNAMFGTILFNAMFIISPEIGQSVFGQAALGEYFRTFMAYGVIGVALGLHVWKANKKNKILVE